MEATAELRTPWPVLLHRWLERVLRPGPTQLLILAVIVGSISGLLSVGFWHGIRLVQEGITRFAAPWLAGTLGAPWGKAQMWAAAFPAVGALVMALIVAYLFRTPKPLGVPSVMYDVHRNPGSIAMRYLPATFVAAALVIGSGGSAGREAPVVAMGGIVGGWMARRLGLSARRRQIFIGCGTGAAIAAAFDAPLAGVFFALEVVLGDYSAATLSPVVLASVAATAVSRALEGEGVSHFAVPAYHLGGWWEIGLYAGLGLAAGLAAPLFVGTERFISRWFERSSVPPLLRPALGGLLVGAIALVLPQVMGNGYEHVEGALLGNLPLLLMAALVFGKILATSLTLGSGGWGGDFAPLLFIGAMLGGSYAAALDFVLPHGWVSSGAYAMVGMGAMLAAGVRCPITAILLLFELTGSYEVILPIMTAIAVAAPVARIFMRRGMYHERLYRMGGPASETPEARLLETVRVAEVVRPQAVTVSAGTPYREILSVIATSDQLVFPVLSTDGRLLGALTFHTLRGHLHAPELAELVVAADVLSEDVPVLAVDDTLEDAMHLFADADLEELPVVRSREGREFAGVVTRRYALAARARLLAEWEMEEA